MSDAGTQRKVPNRRDDTVGAPFAFTSFALAHSGCGKEVIESRLDEYIMACRCLRCGETGIFGPEYR